MPVEPRTPQRRALDPPHLVVPGPSTPEPSPEPVPAPAEAPIGGRHIPLFVVRQQGEPAGRGAMGAHRFPVRPTPVLGASVSLFGLDAVDRAARPWRADRGGYQVTAVHPDGAALRGARLQSRRFPKV